MGSCSIYGHYFSTDPWNGYGVSFRVKDGKKVASEVFRTGIDVIQGECVRRFGDDSYNGTESTVNFRDIGSWENMTTKAIDKTIEARMDELGKRDGCIVKVGSNIGSIIFKTAIHEVNFAPFDTRSVRKGKKEPCVLVEYTEYGLPKEIACGTQAKMKEKAHEMLRRCKYSREYFLVGRSKTLSAYGEAKFMKKTSQKTDIKKLVLPMNEYRYFGWAAE